MEIIKMRNELQPGDVWYVYGGWHRVVRVDHENPGNTTATTRSLIIIQAVTPEDGKHAWGIREWATGLRSDLAAADPCRVRLPDHVCWDWPHEIQTGGALGHGWDCGVCGNLLQVG